MQRLTQLFFELDACTTTPAQLAALQRYWRSAPPGDAAWALHLFSGGKPRKALGSAALKAWALHATGLAEWLFDASQEAVGDLTEAIAHLLPPGEAAPDLGLSDWMTHRILPLRAMDADAQGLALSQWLGPVHPRQRFVLLKLVSGGWRPNVRHDMVVRSLAEHSGLPHTVVAQRLADATATPSPPDADAFLALITPIAEPGHPQSGTQPYPFSLVLPLAAEPGHQDASTGTEPLGPSCDWLVEWAFEGLRAQVIRRGGQTAIWSREGALLTDRFPDIAALAARWPDDTVVEGMLLATRPPQPEPLPSTWPLPFSPAPLAQLQQRLLRQRLTPAVLRQVPCAFVAFDLLAWQGQDLRAKPLLSRRALLDERAAPACHLLVSPLLGQPAQALPWPELASMRRQARAMGMKGLVLKHHASLAGGLPDHLPQPWWVWPTDPLTLQAVLVYAQPDPAQRTGLCCDYTFAVWSRPPSHEADIQTVLNAIATGQPAQPGALQLLTFAKAHSGLGDTEVRQLDALIRQTTVAKFGPVRSLLPSQVFELGFEAIEPSARHKSGVTVRLPRILRWRTDLPLIQADNLGTLWAALNGYSVGPAPAALTAPATASSDTTLGLLPDAPFQDAT